MTSFVQTEVRPVAIGRVDRLAPNSPAELAAAIDAALDAMLRDLDDPLSAIHPGQRVVVKANFVTDRDREHRLGDDELAATCTDPVLLEALVRRAWRALAGQGEILLVDSPIEGTQIEPTLERLGIHAMLERLRSEGLPIQFRDLRDFTMQRHFWLDDAAFWGRSWNLGWLEFRPIAGDPEGYLAIDLKDSSYFEQGFRGLERLWFHPSERKSLSRWHAPGRHVYSVARAVLAADFVLNVPKLKTHKKCGVTLAQKNLIGISNRKQWIPHYRRGAPPEGDEFDRRHGWATRLALRLKRWPLWGGHSAIVNVVGRGPRRPVVEAGNWRGNDVVWRATRDLNTILLYADRQGVLHPGRRQRGYLAVIDGIVAGEGEGPLRPSPLPAGVLVAGTEPLSVDAVATRLMDIPPERVPLVSAPALTDFPLGSCEPGDVPVLPESEESLRIPFRLPSGWE